MNVELYVYDLSGGLARQYSVALTGVHIDAIYHTAVVLGGVEYFFGQGIHRKVPGSTHHGRPMEVMSMGSTDLPLELIEEYIQSLESIYTPESYDLFVHNCNNFSQDLCMFLVGKSIPEKISSLPETFLKTPIGQMMRGQIDQSMRRMTQAPDDVSGRNVKTAASNSQSPPPSTNGIYSSGPTFVNGLSQARNSINTSKHPHAGLSLPVLARKIKQPVLAGTCPPLDKLLTKFGPNATGSLHGLTQYVKVRESKGSSEAPMPDLSAIGEWVTLHFQNCDRFAFIDLLRISAIDPRVSAYLATDMAILRVVLAGYDDHSKDVPYNLHFTTLQLAMNLFSSPVAQDAIIDHENPLRSLLGNLVAMSLLTNNSKIRFQAASLLLNLVAIDHNQRLDGRRDIMNISGIADGAIESAIVQAILDEVDGKALDRLTFAVGLMLYRSPESTGSIWELCEAMDLLDALKMKPLSKEPSSQEVLKLLELH